MFSGTRRITGRAAKTKVMRGFSGLLLAGVKGFSSDRRGMKKESASAAEQTG
jgi:hypothetical protein